MERITEKEGIDIMTINKIMKQSAEKHLKVKVKIKKEKDTKWMTEEVRKEIKKRKELNRKHRYKSRKPNKLI